jgi:Flp pilus assembly protein TadG
MPRTARLWRQWRAFRRDERGATAVEFALVIFPFMLILMGIIELGLMFLGVATLDFGTFEASRDIRTGVAQTAGMDEAAIRTAICENAIGLPNCEARLRVDLRAFPDWNAAAGRPEPINDAFAAGDGSRWQDELEFDPNTGPNTIVIMRAFYEWDMFTPLIGDIMRDARFGAGGEPRLMVSSASIFLTEPFAPNP